MEWRTAITGAGSRHVGGSGPAASAAERPWSVVGGEEGPRRRTVPAGALRLRVLDGGLFVVRRVGVAVALLFAAALLTSVAGWP